MNREFYERPRPFGIGVLAASADSDLNSLLANEPRVLDMPSPEHTQRKQKSASLKRLLGK